jgi:hypothetical protein
MYVIYVMEGVNKQPQLMRCTAVLFQHSAVTSAPPPALQPLHMHRMSDHRTYRTAWTDRPT